MKHQMILTALLLVAAAVLNAADVPQSVAKTKPNVVILLADDLGYGDIGNHGNRQVKTPQMDRFAMQFTLGYVAAGEEVAILTQQQHNHPLDDLRPCATLAEVLALKQAVENVRVSDELKHYMVALVGATRRAPGVQLGASPRASIALMKAAQALALFDGMAFVTPEHVRELAVPVIAHRLVMEPQARFSGLTPQGVIEDGIRRIKVPA